MYVLLFRVQIDFIIDVLGTEELPRPTRATLEALFALPLAFRHNQQSRFEALNVLGFRTVLAKN